MSMRRIAGIAAAAICITGVSASAQSNKSNSKTSSDIRDQKASMTVVGCLMSEPDYRKAHGLGKGAIGGLGLSDEFVLVDAAESPNGTAATSTSTSSSSARCTETGTGKAYRLTGTREEELKKLVGHRIEVTGAFDHERDAKTAAGETNAKLPPEIKIASFREASASAPSTASTNAAPPAQASAAPSTPPPASTEARNETPSREQPLPRTASNLPLVGLIGLMSLAAAFGLRLLSLRTS
jgi:hypothetical protein